MSATTEPVPAVPADAHEGSRAGDHTYIWIESYRNCEALARHSEAPYMADALAKLPGWWSAPPEVTQLRRILSI